MEEDRRRGIGDLKKARMLVSEANTMVNDLELKVTFSVVVETTNFDDGGGGGWMDRGVAEVCVRAYYPEAVVDGGSSRVQ